MATPFRVREFHIRAALCVNSNVGRRDDAENEVTPPRQLSQTFCEKRRPAFVPLVGENVFD
jgi:hypothetical protein